MRTQAKEDNRGSFRRFNRRSKAIGCKQSTYEAAVFDLDYGDIVVVHTGGFWIDALEVARTAEIVVIVVSHGACAGAAAGPTKSKPTGREDEGCSPTDYNHRHEIFCPPESLSSSCKRVGWCMIRNDPNSGSVESSSHTIRNEKSPDVVAIPPNSYDYIPSATEGCFATRNLSSYPIPTWNVQTRTYSPPS